MTDLPSLNYQQLINQLSIFNPLKYIYSLEKFLVYRYEKKISSMNLLILHPNYEKYHIVKIDEFQLETKYLIDNRWKKL